MKNAFFCNILPLVTFARTTTPKKGIHQHENLLYCLPHRKR
nr:MAG TPA: hypothetical protein [Bacteriophage sp.]DAZ52041.1 MAG TPA: hypothetical protein [Caudoviricetes sp.]